MKQRAIKNPITNICGVLILVALCFYIYKAQPVSEGIVVAFLGAASACFAINDPKFKKEEK